MAIKIDPFCSSDRQKCNIGNHHWSVARLIRLARDLPVMRIPLEHLYIWHTYEKLSLREMVGHIKSINAADLSYPIILDEDGVLMDGRHRIMKALLLGKKKIKAVRFEANPSPCREDQDD